MHKKFDYYSEFGILQNIMRFVVFLIPMVFLVVFSLCIFIKSKLFMTPITIFSLLLITGLYFISKRTNLSFKTWLFIIFSVAFLLRILFIFIWPITPLSDCKLGFDMSLALNRTPISGWHECFAKSEYYYEIWPMHAPFIVVQTFCMKLFGESLYSLQFVNMFFSSLTCVFTAMCAEALTKSRKAGIFAGLLMACNITSLFMASFLVNQHISTSLFMLSLYFILKKPFSKPYLNYLVSGMVLGLAHLIRPEMQIILIAFLCTLIYDFFMNLKKENKLKYLFKSLLKLFCFILSFFMIIAIINQLFLTLRWVDNPITESKLSYKLMIGLNQETEGRFKDSDYLLAQNNLAVKETLKERISGPGETAVLMFKKLCFQFSSYNYWWLQADKGGELRQFVINNIFEPITQSYMFFIMILSIVSSFHIFKYHKKTVFLYIIYIGYLCAFSLMEVQQRYAYITIPVITVIAAHTLKDNSNKKRLRSEDYENQ